MRKVRKAVIPAAGLGTRFLPATKTIPKEMLPLVDRPSLLYIVEEAVRAGIEEIILIAGRQKSAIEDFFDRSVELEETLERTGKHDLLKTIRNITSLAEIISVRQKNALGLGHAVYTARSIVGSEPFAVLLGDEVMIGDPNPTQKLKAAYERESKSTVFLMEVPHEDVSKYGIVQARALSTDLYQIEAVVEKPKPATAPSRLALPGRYVFDSKIFDYLGETKPGKNGEIQLTDAMESLARNEGLLGLTLAARRFDTGDKLGFLQANIELGLEHGEIGPALKSYLLKLTSRLK